MARRRKYGEDLTYAEEHRHQLEHLCRRIGHRLDAADRDWTEFCHWCKEPLGIYEQVRDIGQDINDKATTVTRKLAASASLPAFLFAWRAKRPAAVEARIQALNTELRELEAAHPIIGFKAKQLYPRRGELVPLTPDEWWKEGVLILHRDHHRSCHAAKRNRELDVHVPRLLDARNRSRLWTPADQLTLGDAA